MARPLLHNPSMIIYTLGWCLVCPVLYAEVLELEGTVKIIDTNTRAITIVRKTPRGEKVLELEVANNAGDLSGFKEGDSVAFAYNPDLEIVSSLSMQVDDNALLVAGSEWANDEGNLRLRILSRDGDQYTGLFIVNEKGLREVKGKIRGNKIQWLAKDVTSLNKGGQKGGDNFGVLSQDGKGPKLDFRWKGEGGQGGTFTLRKVEAKSEEGDDE